MRAPRFGWQLSSPERGALQSAYQVQVQAGFGASWAADVELLWDTGKLAGQDSLNLVYGGPALHAASAYRWRVRVWDAADRASAWSQPGHWEMGLLDEAHWEAQWIGDGLPGPQTREAFYADDPAPLLRRAFALQGKPQRARLYLAGPGYWEASLNGKPLDDSVLNPSWTDFDQLVAYRVFDVGHLLAKGENVLGVMLGNGWYNPLPLEFFKEINFRDHLATGRPCLRARLVISLEDGSEQVLTSDGGWRVTPGPMLRNNIYLGEVFDARLEPDGWRSPGFDDSGWKAAAQVAGPKGALRADTIEPIRPRAAFVSQAPRETRPGVYVFDAGRNLAGWVRLALRGSAGTRVVLRFSELLNEDGSLNMGTCMAGWVREAGRGGPGAPARAEQRDEYILRGGGEEFYQPRFSFHGFRYVEVSGLEAAPQADDLQVIALQSDLKTVGEFHCSDERLNAIQGLVDNTFRSNLFSVQSDCPHRERLAYGGDIVVTSEAFMLNYDMGSFYPKTALDFALTQGEAGGIAQTAPFVGLAQFGLGEESGPVGWGLALPHLLVQNYRFYGELRQVQEHYAAGQRWLDFLAQRAQDGVIDTGLGDHGNITKRRYIQFVTTLSYARAARAMQRLAEVLGRPAEAAGYAQLAESIHAALGAHKRFSPQRKGLIGDGSQALQAIGLQTGYLKGENYAHGLELLLARLKQDRYAIETGLVGTQDLLEVLGQNEAVEALWELLTRREYPGWGHMLEAGASTLWEVWVDDRVKMSRNHPMLGSVSAFFYRHLAGLQIDPAANACDRITIKPLVPAELESVSAHFDSPRGRIASAWTQDEGVFELRLEIPVGTQALLGLPAGFPNSITESGLGLAEAEGVSLSEAPVEPGAQRRGARTWCRLGAGKYHFRAEAK